MLLRRWEAPLRLRRLQQQIKFAVKVKSTSSHIAKNVFDDYWTNHYGRFSDNKKPLALKVNQFFEDVDMTHVKGPRLGITPPCMACGATGSRSITHAGGQQEWGSKHPGCSDTGQDRSDVRPIRPDLHRRVKTLIRKSRNWLLHSVVRVIPRHRDGSQADQTGETADIKMALENVRHLEQTTTHRRYAISTDSLSTIDNLASRISRSRPNLINCSQNEIAAAVKNICDQRKISFTSHYRRSYVRQRSWKRSVAWLTDTVMSINQES